MPPVITNNMTEHSGSAINKRPSERDNIPVKMAASDYNKNASDSPNYFVNLTTVKADFQNTPVIKKTSIPVTNDEKTALFDSFLGKRNFSIYS